jgi:hypothetical protein
MIKSITVTNYLGDSIKLELGRPEQSGFLIKSVSGLGPSKANINTTEVSTNDGSLFNSARLNQRNIVFDFIFVESINRESIEDIRQKSYKYFPIKKNVDLLIETDNRIVKTTGYVESNEPNIFSSQEGAQISIICPDPYFYSTEKTVTIFSGIEPLFEFPFENNSLTDNLLEFGEIIVNQEKTVFYKGDSEVGIVIYIHAIGEATNLTIYNALTREVLKIDTDRLEALTGSIIKAGDDIIISTIKGEKFIRLIRDGEYINILNCLGRNSDWFRLVKGDNVFAFTAETGDTNLQFRIENLIVYEGV